MILTENTSFRNFLVSRFFAQFGMMASAFFSVYAVKKLGMNNVQVGIMTSILLITQVIMNPVLGRISDLWSRKWVLALGSLSAAASSLLALLIKDTGFFALVFILTGISATAFWMIGITISLEFGDESERPTYVGMANSLIAPAAILAPLLGGLLADSLGYHTTFIASTAFALVACVLLIFKVSDPKKEKNTVQVE